MQLIKQTTRAAATLKGHKSSANVIRNTTSCFTLEWCTSCVSLSSKRSQTANIWCWETYSKSHKSASLLSLHCVQRYPRFSARLYLTIGTCIHTQQHIHTHPIKQTKPGVSDAATQNKAARLAKRRFYSAPLDHDAFFRKNVFPKHRGF